MVLTQNAYYAMDALKYLLPPLVTDEAIPFIIKLNIFRSLQKKRKQEMQEEEEKEEKEVPLKKTMRGQ